MTESGLLVLQIIGGIVFLIASFIITLKMAEDHRWLIWLFLLSVAAWVLSFFVDFGYLYGWISGASIIVVFLIAWALLAFHFCIDAIEAIIEYRRTILISIAVCTATAATIYTIVQFDLYSEFFYALIGLTLLSAIIGKPAAVRELVLSLTKLSIILIIGGVGLYALGAFIYMSYNYGFEIFLEIGSDRFWIAWASYVLFTQMVFGFVLVSIVILIMMPGLKLPTYAERLMMKEEKRISDAAHLKGHTNGTLTVKAKAGERSAIYHSSSCL